MAGPESKRAAPAATGNGSKKQMPQSSAAETYRDPAPAASSPGAAPWSDAKIERRLRRLTDRVDKELDADRQFFERRPERSHRVRLAYPCEAKQFALVGMKAPPGLPGRPALFILVEQVVPGCRFRHPFWASSHLDTDMDEEQVRWLYPVVAPPDARFDRIRKKAREAYK